MVYFLPILVSEDRVTFCVCDNFERPQLGVPLDVLVVKLLANHSFGIIERIVCVLNDLSLSWLAAQKTVILLLVADHGGGSPITLLILHNLHTLGARDSKGRIRGTQVDTDNVFDSLNHLY